GSTRVMDNKDVRIGATRPVKRDSLASSSRVRTSTSHVCPSTKGLASTIDGLTHCGTVMSSRMWPSPEVNASSAIPIVKLCVIECPWSTPKYESSGFHSMQDRVEFCVAKVERIMVALESFCAVAKEQGKTFVDPHRCKMAVVTLGGKPKELREKAGRSFLVMCWNDGVVEYNRHHPLLTGFNDLCLAA